MGLGGSHSPIGDVAGHVVYAMRVTRVLSLGEYDAFCRRQLKGKIPKWNSDDFRERVGDCIYDFAGRGEPRLRPSVHAAQNRRVDLSGKNGLLSEHFYYFGDKPVQLPAYLAPIVHQTQGHKSRANEQHAVAFVEWIETLGFRANRLHGAPQLTIEPVSQLHAAGCSSARDLKADEADEIC